MTQRTLLLIYSHPERDRCAYHVDTVVDEIVLCFLAFVGAEPGMIGDCTDAIFGQFFDQRLRTVAAHAVDDAALPVVSVDEMDNRSDLFLFTQSATDSERQVRAVERRDECFRITQFQLIQDVRPGDFVCRSRQGDDRYFREILFQNGQLGIFGTEIMPPMRDTMRFVDSDQRNVDAGQEPVQFTYDPFGRDVEQFHFSRMQSCRTRWRSSSGIMLLSAAAGMPLAISPSTWSFIKAIRGDTTMAVPGI